MRSPGRHRHSSLRRSMLGVSAAALLAGGVAVPLALTGAASATSGADAQRGQVVRTVEQWDRDVDQRASGGAYVASATAGDSFILRFAGTSVAVDAPRGVDGGLAEVFLDGVKQGRVSFYADRPVWRTSVWATSGLPDRGHSLQLVVSGRHQAGSHGDWVYVDDVDVDGPSTYQENAPNVQMNWSAHPSSQAAGHRYVAESHVARGDSGPAPRRDVTFVGTAISLLACKSPSSGLATIYLDGRAAGQIDLYQHYSSCAQKVYTSPTLPLGRHQLRVEVTGFRDAVSAGTTVGLDSVVVH